MTDMKTVKINVHINVHTIILKKYQMILLRSIDRLGVKLPICVYEGLALFTGRAACVSVIRRQGINHCSQALDTQLKQLRLIGLQN